MFSKQVGECIARGIFRRGAREAVADGLWATAHGMVSLELAGYFRDQTQAKARFVRAVTATAEGYRREVSASDGSH